MMREVEIYQIKQQYIAGDIKNIQVLYDKLRKDEVLLNEIEEDYNNDLGAFEKEYVTAKINHLKNRYTHSWLILKWHFEQAWFTETSSFTDFQKEEMKSHGWMFPQAFINSKITTSGGVSVSTEELYIRNFDALFDNLFDFNIGEKNSRVDRYYKQAIFNYKNKCYYSCVVSLFPIIESYHQFINGFYENKFYRIKDNLDRISHRMEDVKQIYAVKISYYIDLVKQFNDLAGNHYFNKSIDRANEPEIINRNRLMHGVFSREVSQKDCLQLFCVISNMVVIKSMIDASDNMYKIEEELKSLLKTNN